MPRVVGEKMNMHYSKINDIHIFPLTLSTFNFVVAMPRYIASYYSQKRKALTTKNVFYKL